MNPLTSFLLMPAALRWLLLANLVVFVPLAVSSMIGFDLPFVAAGWLVLVPSLWYEPWRFLTYAFVHVQVLHFLFNMLMLWMFGSRVVQVLGSRSFLLLYAFGAVCSGLLAVPFYLLGMGANAHILGASGAIFAIMVAFARFEPDGQLLLFFLFPVPMRWAIWILMAIDLLMIGSGDGVAHLVHLGGAAAGFIFLYFHDRGYEVPKVVVSRWTTPKPRGRPVGGNQTDDEAELDRILTKISHKGMGAVTPSERAWLEEMSRRRRSGGPMGNP